MKKYIFIILAIFVLFSANAQQTKWTNNSTEVLEKGRKEIGIFSPLTIGLKDTMQISVHPIWFFMIPNAELKKFWKSFKHFDITTKHSITYPTLLYKIISRRGTGGILPATTTIPQMFKVNNSLLIGNKFNDYLCITANIGIDMTFSFGNSDFPDIEFPVVYPRTYSFNNFLTPYFGLDLSGNIYKNFFYDNKTNLFLLTTNNKGQIIEDELKLIWNISNKLSVKGGAIYTYGDFPFGENSKIYPVFDVVFGF